jgi:hypothetical protein
MILHILNAQRLICCSIVYEICMAPKADSIAYEYQRLHQHDIYEYAHHGLTAKRANVTKWRNFKQYGEVC